jgi:hypothetical protein
MANGRLASGVISSTNVWEQFYQVPVGFTASITLNVCNQGANNAKIRVAIPSSTNVNPEDIIEYDVEIYKNESFQRTGIVLSSGQYLFIRSNEGSISVNIWGFEEEI